MPNPDRHPSTQARAFTLLEMLFSILIIGILMALLIIGAVSVTRAARTTADRQGIKSVQAGISEFKKEFGFLPPLMKEQIDIDEATGGPANPSTVVTAGRARVDVYLITVDADVMELHNVGLLPPYDPTNPMLDPRFSTRSLAVYLAGGLNVPVTASSLVPLDGIAGPGLYKPQQDGTFLVPADVLAASTTSSRTGVSFQPFVNLGDSSPKLYVSPISPYKVELRDVRDTPLRYYRWLPGREQPPGSRQFVTETPADLNVPYMVARDYADPMRATEFAYFKNRTERDLLANAAVRGATYAIVGAGPNGLFGDEDRAVLARKLGHGDPAGWGAGQLLQYRGEAEADNIVEVGQ